MKRFIVAAFFVLIAGPAFAQTAASPSPEEVEARTEAISKTLRCVVCQNQTIHESAVPLAEDMKALVKRRVEAGDTDAEVRAYMVERYGEFVLMKPPIKAETWALWGLPFILLFGAVVWYIARSHQRQVGDTALEFTDEERTIIEQTLKGGDAS